MVCIAAAERDALLHTLVAQLTAVGTAAALAVPAERIAVVVEVADAACMPPHVGCAQHHSVVADASAAEEASLAVDMIDVAALALVAKMRVTVMPMVQQRADMMAALLH